MSIIELILAKVYMFRRSFLTIVTSLMSLYAVGQRGLAPDVGARGSALGNISTVLDDGSAVLGNFASLDQESGWGLMLSSERRFGLSELTSFSAGLYTTTKNLGDFGIQLSTFGFELYNEQIIKGLYRRKLAKGLSASLSMGLYQLSLEEFGKVTTVLYDLGFHGKIGSQIRYGVTLANILNFEITPENSLRSQIRVGVEYGISDRVHAYAEARVIQEQRFGLGLGIEYTLLPQFLIRLGTDTSRGLISGGFRYAFAQKLKIDGAVSVHNVLGTSSGLSLLYSHSHNAK